MTGAVHVIGGGIAGLGAAVALSRDGRPVTLHEASNVAGGRCRSYVDPALGIAIDNGNHLVLAGNRAVMAYAKAIGAADKLVGAPDCVFDFIDLRDGERWRLRPNLGALPWWLFSRDRRAPGTSAYEYMGAVSLLLASRDKTIGQTMKCSGPVYERVWRPILLAALNTEPEEASAALAAAVIRETLAKGGWACRPLVAFEGLGVAFVDPALALLRERGAEVKFGARARALRFEADRVVAIDFGAQTLAIGPDDAVVLATPAGVATALAPGLEAPTVHRAIVNAHYLFDAPAGSPMMTGVVNGAAEWVFAFPGRVSVTVSAGDAWLETPREELAARLWSDVETALGVKAPLPRWQIVREKRATFAALPAEDARRPATRTPWNNLVLAGDYTATGLPATLEGALRSSLAASVAVGGPAAF